MLRNTFFPGFTWPKRCVFVETKPGPSKLTASLCAWIPSSADPWLASSDWPTGKRYEVRGMRSGFRIGGLLLSFLILYPSSLYSFEWQQGNGFRFAKLPVPASGKTGFTRMPPEATGILFTNFLSEESVAKNRILENGSGVALGDVDGDGLCDIYLCRLEGPNVLYRNLGNGKFQDITETAGVACDGQFSTGAVLADIDGDGDLDLLVNCIGGGTRAFLNDGHGHFTEMLDTRLVRRF